MNKTILILITLLLFNNICSQSTNQSKEVFQDELNTCEKHSENSEQIQNTFLLKTNLSQSEIEELLSQDFDSLSKNRRKNPNIKRITEDDVKHFKSKDLNKTISLLEINNISEYSNELKENNENKKSVPPYELIDIKGNNETKIFLSFDKFFKSQYKEMFEYSYTIIIFFFVLIGMIIYYAMFLPTEANELTRTSRNNRPILENISNDGSVKNDSENDYILKE